jgi:two-component system, cell cycle sensor histidine kinase and response regulator CckA
VTIDAAHAGSRIDAEPGDYIVIAVSDTGCGMDRETRSHLFEPFFTTKPKGTGLGLATVHGIVRQNNGFIDVHSEPGHGSLFRVHLPRVEEAEADARGPSSQGIPRGSETVLVVEDEPAILRLCVDALAPLGYTVLACQSPREALAVASAHEGAIDLLVTDVVMPDMNGRQLAEQLSAARRGLRCLYVSGYTADVIAHHGVVQEGVSFIAKPFKLSDFATRVRAALDGPGTGPRS